MKKAGLILIIIQVLAIVSGLISGSFIKMLADCASVTGVATLLGFLLPCIIGIILLIKGNKKSK